MIKLINIRHILLACLLGMTPLTSFGFVSITIAPPELVVYEQPPCPTDGWLWVPGYWAYGDDGYYWVPGVWVEPPHRGLLWTPGYWGFDGGVYAWHGGYWGPHVGFYGGINYGFGYGGVGFFGGEWQGDAFRYNTAVTRVDTTVVRNTYVNNTVINNTTVNNRASFNGTGGVTAKPTADEQKASQEQHIAATDAQRTHEQAALHDPSQSAKTNNGRPATTALTSVKGHEPKTTGANVSGQPTPRLETKPGTTPAKPGTTQATRTPTENKPGTTAAKPGTTQATRTPTENKLKSEERTKAGRQEQTPHRAAPAEPNVQRERAPAQTRQETHQPAEKKPASKPQPEKSSGKEEKKKE
jgi:YXWGXW repeat-containing protein